MLFAERGIFCRFTGVRLQRPRTFWRLVKLGAWVVFHRGQGPGREGPKVLQAWQLQPFIWGLLWYCWCYSGVWRQENLR